jgi:class 3 adenylate cyclase
MAELDQLRSSIDALAAQRATLGDAVVDQAIAPLLRRAEELERGIRPADHEGERKHITVMFADLSGFTALSERSDAEDIRNWVNDCFAQLGEVVKRYGGYIDKFIGDELMVLFGAPRAIEDHASRALHAALDMRAALAAFNREHERLRERDLSMHFGINSGVVIAGAMGVEGRRQYTVMGDTVNVAARLAARAEAGEILIGADARRLVGDGFTFRNVGLVELEGRAEAVQASALLSARSDAHSLREPLAPAAPMFGRDRELRILRDIFDEVVAQRRSRSVTVAGLAGIGKSRMLREFRAWVEDSHPAATFLVGEALPHMTMTPYFMIASTIRNAVNVREGEPAAAIHTRLAEALADAGISDPASLHGLEAILGIESTASGFEDLAPQDRKDRISSAATTVIRELASGAGGAVVIAFEDLHWADDLSIDLLDHVFSELADAPVLFLTTTRPIVDEESKVRQLESHRAKNAHTVITLAELDNSASESLVRTLAPGLDRSQHAVDTIVQRGQGNPFFIESVVGALSDRGILVRDAGGVALADAIESVDVPETVFNVLADRIDRLPADEKRVVQMAAIVGRLFWEGLVHELTARPAAKHLQALNQREFVDRLGPAAFAGEWEWIFKHILLQEVAYNSLLRETKRAGHRAAAEWLDQRVGDRRKEYATLLAYHYQRAEEWAKTAEFAEAAGDRAVSLFAHREAKDAYIQALDALAHLPADEEVRRRQVDVTLKLGRASSYLPSEDVHDRLQHARKLSEDLGDPERQLRVDTALALWLYVAGRAVPAVQLAMQCVAKADPRLEELLVVPFNILGRAAFVMGDYSRCVEMLERSDALARRYPKHQFGSGLAPVQIFLGLAYAIMGEIEKGQELALGALRAAEAAGDVRHTAAVLMLLGALRVGMGRTEGAADHLRKAAQLSEETGDATQTYIALGYLGEWHALRGELDEATHYLDRALAIAAEVGTVLLVPCLEAYRAAVDVRAGRAELAVPRAKRAAILGKETWQQTFEGEALRMLGWALHFAEPAAHEEAEGAFRSAADLHRKGNARSYYARTLTDLAAYLRLIGDDEGAAEVEAEVSAVIRECRFDWMPVPPPMPLIAHASRA